MKLAVLAISAVVIASPALASDLASMTGVWVTDDADGRVEIFDCGNATPCGRLVNVEDPSFIDGHNPDPALRTRSLEGLVILSGFKPSRRGAFKKGRIYNPGDGKSYRSALSMTDEGQLRVKGCVGPFCQSQYWTRLPE